MAQPGTHMYLLGKGAEEKGRLLSLPDPLSTPSPTLTHSTLGPSQCAPVVGGTLAATHLGKQQPSMIEDDVCSGFLRQRRASSPLYNSVLLTASSQSHSPTTAGTTRYGGSLLGLGFFGVFVFESLASLVTIWILFKGHGRICVVFHPVFQ